MAWTDAARKAAAEARRRHAQFKPVVRSDLSLMPAARVSELRGVVTHPAFRKRMAGELRQLRRGIGTSLTFSKSTSTNPMYNARLSTAIRNLSRGTKKRK